MQHFFIDAIKKLNKDKLVDGILVQLPLPKHLDETKILNLIPGSKDVDGFLAENVGKLLLFENSTVACTPYGVLELLKRENIEIAGKNAVVIGGGYVGIEIAENLTNLGISVDLVEANNQVLSIFDKDISNLQRF